MERFSLGDAAELAGDVGPDPRLIGVLAELDRPIALAALRELIAERLPAQPILARRVVRNGPATWNESWQRVDVRVEDHVFEVRTSDPLATATRLAGEDLGHEVPAWRLILLSGPDASALLFAARRLTAALAGWLTARQAGVREAVLRLQHRRDETRVSLQFAELTADNARFERVLRERLERMTLAAPVETLCLEATQVNALPGCSRSLLDDAQASRETIGTLLERLTARLGDARVYRIVPHADHRPECATRRLGLFEKTSACVPTVPPRPLWLLDLPEPLREVDGRPFRRGPLQLLTGPERIESGWWDAGEKTGDLRRDYFIAGSQDGTWLWIYRECSTGGWFLHGYFS